jgi:hypothetical protein
MEQHDQQRQGILHSMMRLAEQQAFILRQRQRIVGLGSVRVGDSHYGGLEHHGVPFSFISRFSAPRAQILWSVELLLVGALTAPHLVRNASYDEANTASLARA